MEPLRTLATARPRAAISSSGLRSRLALLALLVLGGICCEVAGLFAESVCDAHGRDARVTFEEGSVAYLNTRTEVRWIGNEHDRRVALM